MTQLEGLLTEDETAEALGVVVATLRNWRSRREGPPSCKLGRATRYRHEALMAWIQSREQTYELIRPRRGARP